ncbi:MAG: helix-turn-helix domain-containing protein [Chloroflexota bacterium]
MTTSKAGQLCEVREVAQRLACTPKHVFELVRSGKIRAIRIGKRRIRVFRESVDRFITDHEIKPDDYYE